MQWQDFSSRKYQGCHGMAPIDFGRSVIPISARGGILCPPHYYWCPRIFRPSYGPVEWSFAIAIFQEWGKAFECILYIHYQATKNPKGIKTLIELLTTWFHQFPILNSEFSQVLFVNYCFLFYQTILIGLKKS